MMMTNEEWDCIGEVRKLRQELVNLAACLHDVTVSQTCVTTWAVGPSVCRCTIRTGGRVLMKCCLINKCWCFFLVSVFCQYFPKFYFQIQANFSTKKHLTLLWCCHRHVQHCWHGVSGAHISLASVFVELRARKINHVLYHKSSFRRHRQDKWLPDSSRFAVLLWKLGVIVQMSK